MGYFSWETSDTNESIPNVNSKRDTFTVHMLDDKGNVFVEPAYKGYGVFGGKDFYELLAEMNEGVGDRSLGINLSSKPESIQPKLVRNLGVQWGDLPNSSPDSHQGFFY